MTRIDQLEKQHRPVTAHRQIADLVDDQQRRMSQYPQTARQLARRLGLFQRFDQPGQGAEVNPASGLGGGNGQAYGDVRFPDTRRLRNPSSCRLSICSRLILG